jgi:hypothetical protein
MYSNIVMCPISLPKSRIAAASSRRICRHDAFSQQHDKAAQQVQQQRAHSMSSRTSCSKPTDCRILYSLLVNMAHHSARS